MKILFVNKKINLNYFITETYEAGIVLTGYEVKSLIKANANIDQSFITFKNNEAWILNMYVAPYQSKQAINLDPTRNRKLLLNRNEIIRIQNKIKKEKMTVIPSKFYMSKNNIKVEICLCKSKHHKDKREDLKKRDAQREIKKYEI